MFSQTADRLLWLRNASTRCRSIAMVKPLHTGDTYVSHDIMTTRKKACRPISVMPWCRSTLSMYNDCALSSITRRIYFQYILTRYVAIIHHNRHRPTHKQPAMSLQFTCVRFNAPSTTVHRPSGRLLPNASLIWGAFLPSRWPAARRVNISGLCFGKRPVQIRSFVAD